MVALASLFGAVAPRSIRHHARVAVLENTLKSKKNARLEFTLEDGNPYSITHYLGKKTWSCTPHFLKLHISPVLSFDVLWSPALRRQQNDQLWEYPEILSLVITALTYFDFCCKDTQTSLGDE